MARTHNVFSKAFLLLSQALQQISEYLLTKAGSDESPLASRKDPLISNRFLESSPPDEWLRKVESAKDPIWFSNIVVETDTIQPVDSEINKPFYRSPAWQNDTPIATGNQLGFCKDTNNEFRERINFHDKQTQSRPVKNRVDDTSSLKNVGQYRHTANHSSNQAVALTPRKPINIKIPDENQTEDVNKESGQITKQIHVLHQNLNKGDNQTSAGYALHLANTELGTLSGDDIVSLNDHGEAAHVRPYEKDTGNPTVDRFPPIDPIQRIKQEQGDFIRSSKGQGCHGSISNEASNKSTERVRSAPNMKTSTKFASDLGPIVRNSPLDQQNEFIRLTSSQNSPDHSKINAQSASRVKWNQWPDLPRCRGDQEDNRQDNTMGEPTLDSKWLSLPPLLAAPESVRKSVEPKKISDVSAKMNEAQLGKRWFFGENNIFSEHW